MNTIVGSTMKIRNIGVINFPVPDIFLGSAMTMGPGAWEVSQTIVKKAIQGAVHGPSQSQVSEIGLRTVEPKRMVNIMDSYDLPSKSLWNGGFQEPYWTY